MAGKIFINYRRDEPPVGATHAVAIAGHLEKTFGKRSIFIDVDHLRAGLKFRTVLEAKLRQCKVMLAIIVPNWVDTRDEKTGSRRIDDPEDWVRVEIERALARSIPVIPVLVAGARLPSKSDLPPTLQPLIEHQCATVTTTGFSRDMAALARDVADLTVRRPWGRIAAAASVLILGGYVVAHQLGAPVWWPFSQPNVVEAPSTPSTVPAGKPTDEQAKQIADEAEAKRRAEAKAKEEAEAKQIADEAEAKRRAEAKAKEEAEAKQIADEAEAKRRTDEQAKIEADRRQAEAEAKQRADEEAAAKAEEDRKRAAEAKRRADEQAAQRDPALSVKPGSGQSFRDRLADSQPCPMCPEMVVVPAGTFTMGSPDSEIGHNADESPQQTITFSKPFAVGKFHVTVGQFKAFVDNTKYEAGSKCNAYDFEGGRYSEKEGRSWDRPGFKQDSDAHPAVCLSWNDAKAYVDWLARKTGKAYRLLTEAEWEYAARARTKPGTYPRYSFGNAFDNEEKKLCDYGNGADQSTKKSLPLKNRTFARCPDGYVYTSPVGSFLANGFGLYDMQGNAWQWTDDCWHNSYAVARPDGTFRTAGDCDLRVVRGGSWLDKPLDLRAALRNRIARADRYYNIGFRVARTLNP
jgi:formylglycine-generating enzyme required for sulfatase activity